jgi:outer membrane lipoprotein-sorting protein
MNEPDEIKRFNCQLDELLNNSFRSNSRHSSEEYRQMLEIASRLSESDFSASSRQRFQLGEHLRQLAEDQFPRSDRWQSMRTGFALAAHSLAWAGACVLLVAVISWAYLRLLPQQSLAPPTQLAGVTEAPAATQPPLVPTSSWAGEPELIEPLPTAISGPATTPLPQVSVPEEKLLTYRDAQLGYAIDYPASWSLQAEDGILVKVNSPLTNELQSEAQIPADTEVEIVPSQELEGNTLEDVLAQVREENRVLWEENWQLAGHTPAVRLLAEDDEGQWAGLLTVIHGHGLRVSGRGDLTQFDAIASTLRPSAQVNLQPTSPPNESSLKPLTSSSNFNQVRERLESSWKLWKTLWVDARITTTQNGKTRVKREQVWIQQPDNGLWLSGPVNGNPTKVRIKSNGQTVQVNLESRNRKELGDTRLVPSLLYKMLLPYWPLALQDGTYQITGEEIVAGRQAIVVQYTNVEGQKADRLWVDAESGVILRWVNVAISKSGSGNKTSQEIEITSIVYNADFPQELFNLKSPPPMKFAEAPYLVPADQEGSKSK